MSFIVNPSVEAYAEEHTTPDGELFERLAAETREKTTAPDLDGARAAVGRSDRHL